MALDQHWPYSNASADLEAHVLVDDADYLLAVVAVGSDGHRLVLAESRPQLLRLRDALTRTLAALDAQVQMDQTVPWRN